MVSERGRPFSSSQTDFATSNQPYFVMKLFFSGDITSWTGKWRLPCMEDFAYHHCRHYYYGGCTRSSYTIQAQSLFFELGPEDGGSGCQAPSQTFSWCLGFPRDMPGFLCGSQATVNKLSHSVEAFGLKMSRSQGHWAQDPAIRLARNNFLP